MAYRKTLVPKLFWSLLSRTNTGHMVFKTPVLSMNERIKELMVQVCKEQGLPFTVEHNRAYMLDNFSEKFAELIVRECAKLNKHQSYELMGVITDVEEGDGFDDVCLNTVKRVAEHLAKDLKEHFGVEE